MYRKLVNCRRLVNKLCDALALALKHRQIPPSLHFETPNPKILFQELRLRVPTALEPWPNGKGPRLAGINSFGFGGTNAHVAIAETPENAGVGREKFTLNQYRPSSA